MSLRAFLLLLISLTLPCSVLMAATPAPGPKPRVILDADMDSDVDDVEALAIAHALADRGEIELLGVVITSDDPFAPLCASTLNHFFGRPELPVAFLKNQPVLKNHSRYTRQLATEFPRSLARHEDAPDTTALYRKLLASSPDGSVVIVTIGHLTSLQRLLESPPDAVSPLKGMGLAERKVARWICMGGMFPRGKEANFYRPDPNSTVVCLREWTRPAIFCGWELGNPIKTGGAYLKSRLPAEHPVTRAYELYNNFAGRASWDQVAMLLLSVEGAAFFSPVSGGHCRVEPDGTNEWRTDQVRAHEYLVLKSGVAPETVARFIDDLVPKKGAK